MKKIHTYIIVLLLAMTSCQHVSPEKTNPESLNESSIMEQKDSLPPSPATTSPMANAEIPEEPAIQENRNALNLKWTPIDSTTYFAYQQQYTSNISFDSTIVNKAGSFFTLTVKNAAQKFSCDLDYTNCIYYKGFLDPLNKYILTYCGAGYCATYLLDKENGARSHLQSPFDTECETPVLSRDERQFITFASSVFARESFIALYRKAASTDEIDLTTFDSFYTSEWRIKEMIWVDHQSIALQVYDERGGKSGNEWINTRYLKGDIQ